MLPGVLPLLPRSRKPWAWQWGIRQPITCVPLRCPRLIPGTSELQHHQMVSLRCVVPKLVVICYGSNRKIRHNPCIFFSSLDPSEEWDTGNGRMEIKIVSFPTEEGDVRECLFTCVHCGRPERGRLMQPATVRSLSAHSSETSSSFALGRELIMCTSWGQKDQRDEAWKLLNQAHRVTAPKFRNLTCYSPLGGGRCSSRSPSVRNRREIRETEAPLLIPATCYLP